MSFQSATETMTDNKIIEISDRRASQFEAHIAKSCKSDEWSLRKWLSKVLARAGFELFEDGYLSDRCQKEPRYKAVHNLLAIRGNAKVCLVAHTDVCRDHDALKSDYRGMSEYWAALNGVDKDDLEVLKPPSQREVDPVIKLVSSDDGTEHRIIQDRNCDLQVGGDDRLGVAINTWVALNTQYPMALYFPTDEEIGLKSARMVEFPQLKDFDVCVQVDRQNRAGDELVVKINGDVICDYDTAAILLEVAYNMGMPRSPVSGLSTDVAALKSRGMIKNGVNMTCGYIDSQGSSPNEYIDVQIARDTMKYVSEIVKHYYMVQN